MAKHSDERLSTARRFWDASARWDVYRAIYDSPEVADPTQRERAFEDAGLEDARRLARFLRPDMRVLDLGCGMGRVIRPLAPLCREIIGLDISESMLAEAKGYLHGIDNVRLVHTPGAELPGVEDRSLDFVYSLLCLIHVDKRNAYRYMREIARALEPGGLTFLQLENILSDEGLAEFQRVTDLDGAYPLELYSAEEARRLLESVGLGVLSISTWREFLFVSAVRGSAEAWIRETREGVHLGAPRAEGLFADDVTSLSAPGRLVLPVKSTLGTPRTVSAWVALRAVEGDCEGERYVEAEAPVVLEPGRECEIELVCAGDRQLTFLVDGEPTRFQVCLPGPAEPPSEAVLALSLLPSGFEWSVETLALFPGNVQTRRISITG